MAIPTEYQQGLQQLQRRRAIADALAQQSMTPIQQQISGTGSYPIAVKTSPLEVLSKLAQSYASTRANRDIDSQYEKIAQAMAGNRQQALAGLTANSAPPAAPANEPPPLLRSPDYQSPPPAKTGIVDRLSSMQAAIDAGVDPSVIAASAPPKAAPYTLNPGDVRFDDQNRQVAGVPSAPPKRAVEWHNVGDQIVPKYSDTGEDVPGLKPMKMGMTPTQTAAQGTANFLSPEGMDLAAQEYLNTGKLPPGLGKAAAGINAKIVSRAADMAAANGNDAQAAALNRAAFKSAQTGLTALTKQRTLVGAFERTALKNLQIAMDESEKVDRTGSPAVNRWLLAGKKNVGGDVEVGRFNAALTSALNEYAKVLSGATGAAGISDAARREAEELLSTANTSEQVRGIFDIMKREMANREAGFSEQEAQLKETMSGRPAVEVAPAESGPPRAPGASNPRAPSAPSIDDLVKKYGGH